MKIAVFGSVHQAPHVEQLNQLLTMLRSHGVTVAIRKKFYDYLYKHFNGAVPADEIFDSPEFTADYALSIGGDGTFLRTTEWVEDKQIPILGINTGHLGYLSAATADDPQSIVEDLINNNYEIQDRSLIAVTVNGGEAPGWAYALNEVTITKQDTSSMITVDALINGRPLGSYPADGLIISTPTGSTGYNLSVGGPILQPTAPVWTISPIAAHSLTMRPLVINDDAVIEVVPHTNRADNFRLSLDSRSTSLPVGTTITLRRAPFVVKVMHRRGHTFTESLRTKLYWGMDQR
jgi:NAD+ kinase